MTYTDDLIRLKDARISALELELNKLKEELEWERFRNNN